MTAGNNSLRALQSNLTDRLTALTYEELSCNPQSHFHALRKAQKV